MPKVKNTKANLSIILLTPDNYESIRKVIACYETQTIAKEIELVIAIARPSELNIDEKDMLSFHSYQVVKTDGSKNVGTYKADAVSKAQADVIVFGEDHSFPLKNWADVLLKRHEGPWAAVGPRIVNPNPKKSITWVQSHTEYGSWLDEREGGESDFLPGHNSSYKKKYLLEYGDNLPNMLQSEYILFIDVRRKGHKLFYETGAVTRHLNFEMLFPLLRVCFLSGWQFAGARTFLWNWPRKLFYVGGSPLIPVVRFVRIIKILKRGNNVEGISLSLVALLMINLIADALGQLMGYAFGIGNATVDLFPYEFHREKYVVDKDMLNNNWA